MVFHAGLRDPCTRDVARLSESVKIHEINSFEINRRVEIHKLKQQVNL
jgi:hypothetical protein